MPSLCKWDTQVDALEVPDELNTGRNSAAVATGAAKYNCNSGWGVAVTVTGNYCVPLGTIYWRMVSCYFG